MAARWEAPKKLHLLIAWAQSWFCFFRSRPKPSFGAESGFLLGLQTNTPLGPVFGTRALDLLPALKSRDSLKQHACEAGGRVEGWFPFHRSLKLLHGQWRQVLPTLYSERRSHRHGRIRHSIRVRGRPGRIVAALHMIRGCHTLDEINFCFAAPSTKIIAPTVAGCLTFLVMRVTGELIFRPNSLLLCGSSCRVSVHPTRLHG